LDLGCKFGGWTSNVVTLSGYAFYFRNLINPISAVFEKMFCGQRSQQTSVEGPSDESGKPLPGSDSVEASRRRYIKLLHPDLYSVTA